MNRKSKKLRHLLMLLAVDLALLILISTFCTSEALATRMGCSGERVVAIQQALCDRGVFSGKISGVYCTATASAIKKFQQNEGIEKSGEADYNTLSRLGIGTHTNQCFTLQTELLARCIQQSDCRNYAEMVAEGREILSNTKAARTLGSFVSKFYPDVRNDNEPSSEAYAAALQAIREQ